MTRIYQLSRIAWFGCYRPFRACFWAQATLAIGILFLLAMPPVAAFAHGGGVSQLTNAEAGPYRLFAWTQPEPWRVGDVHVSIGVTQPPPPDAVIDEGVTNNLLDQPVTDAAVAVTLTPVNDGGPSITVDALPLEQLDSLYYEADAVLPSAGDWRVRVEVSGPEGRGSADFVTQVFPARSMNVLYMLAGVVAVGLLLIALIGRRRGRAQR